MEGGAHPKLDRVVLAISSYRTDEAVISLLKKVFSNGPPPFHSIVVVELPWVWQDSKTRS